VARPRSRLGDDGSRCRRLTERGVSRLIQVKQNATIIVKFKNSIDQPSTVHWHGVRLENKSDGVPGMTQDSVMADINRLSVLTVTRNRRSASSPMGCSAIDGAAPE
jgi:hypothetical protein